ncbi:helix-turn-helix transcriptional regulator [Actinophytocola sediminis]
MSLIYADEIVLADQYSFLLDRMRNDSVSILARQAMELLTGRIAFLLGDAAAATVTLERLLARPVHVAMRGLTVAWLVEALVNTGQVAAAWRVLAEHNYTGEFPAMLPNWPDLLAARGAAAVAEGRVAEGLADFLACGRELGSRELANPAVISWAAPAARAALVLGQVDRAAALSSTELGYARRWGSPRAIGRALAVEALLARGQRAADLADEAAGLLDVAHARNESPELLIAFGNHLSGQGIRGSAARMLRRAIELATECHNPHWADRAGAALRAVTTHALTEQERKVAILAGAGYKNSEIADRLSVARRTVEFHLSATYRKLGISGRRELSTTSLD